MSLAGGLVVADASTAKARKPSPGLEAVNDFDAVLPVGPLVALKESPAPPTWERTYIELMSPLPVVMGAGRLLADDDERLNGDISMWISASVQ
jgi:hypothetical protein